MGPEGITSATMIEVGGLSVGVYNMFSDERRNVGVNRFSFPDYQLVAQFSIYE